MANIIVLDLGDYKKKFEDLFYKLDFQRRSNVIIRSFKQSGLRLTGWIKRKRLSGARPRYLGVVTGRLRSSITSRTRKAGDSIETTVGTNVEYAAAHELGFNERVQVRSHIRRHKKKVRFTRVSETGKKRRLTRTRFSGYSNVRAHARFMGIGKRAFLAPAIEDRDNQKMILNNLVKNINKAIKGKT